ncbi:protein PELOTA 1-like [Neltuma alba]|uniref:protein PELOTA 1-like n=1 Tax=Neltuma alba TaxID=207710 RepID=UPI0010A2BBB3|nr:protein PELOTA 1-like [Prosopis alba]XP_028789629.1 protein PELOTA 1-like [Prosopis alba]
MKLLDKDFALNQPGTVKIIPEEPDDLWVVYNLIAIGDVVTADTTRKVHLEATKNTASRVKVTIPVKVTRRDFQKDSSTVRVQGRNIGTNQYVASGSFHTLTIEMNKGFELSKKIWDSTAVAALSETSKKSPGADLAVILIQEGQTEVYLVGNGPTTLCSKIKDPRTGKKSASNVFFRDIFNAFVKHVDFSTIKTVLIASDGPTKDEFRQFLLSEAKRLNMKTIENNKSRIVVAGCKGDLKEVLSDKGVMNMIKDSKVVLEIRAFQELCDLLDNNSGRACYGTKHVEAAQEMMAIDTLLITDDLYRSSDAKTRHKYTNLAESVRKGGGKVLVYTSMHVSAEQLAQLTGVAATLRFPLPDLDDADV